MVRKNARFLAPIALASVAVGVYLIVHSSLAEQRATTGHTTASIVHGARLPSRRGQARFYVVKSGDTLSAIAARTGVPLTRLTALNPAVSAPPYSLQAGQRLRLRR